MLCQHCIMSLLSLLLIFIICAFMLVVKSEIISDIVNLEVYSKVDLKNQLVRVKNEIVFVNKGSNVMKTYKYAINEPELHSAAFYNEQGHELDFKRIKSNASWFEVTLSKDVLTNQQYTLSCKITYADKILPAVKQRTMEEDQLMKFEGNVRFYSPYPTEYFKIEYLIKNDSLIEASKTATHVTSDKLIYVFYDVQENAIDHLRLIFVNNDVFLVIKTLHRTIDVNHFGKVFIEDNVVVQNSGPRVVGPYLYHLQMKSKGITNWLYTHLPASAANIKYFDILGNITQSKIYYFANFVTLKFKTRYPLAGGWKISYILRYEVPIHEYLFFSENTYSLQIRAVDYVIDDTIIEDAVVKIILPEGALLRKINKPSYLSLANAQVGCSGGLCIFGRQIIVMEGHNLFDNYVVTIGVDYFLNSLFLLRAPVVISVYLESIFIIILCVKYFIV